MGKWVLKKDWAVAIGTIVAAGTLTLSAAQQPGVGAAGDQPSNGHPANGHADHGGVVATATLEDATGRHVGQAEFRETPNGVLIEVTGLTAPPGTHAIHIHETGRCDAPSFESAGGHFNPEKSKHGYSNAAGPHAGDLPNVHIPDTGKLNLEQIAAEVTLAAGAASLFDADGSALVVHAGADDYASDPAGDAGGRYACGVIER
jgi:Cu-Zn family superoxide dismutase